MTPNPFASTIDNLPEVLPIFPLNGVLLLPFGNLPLNIFEDRYLAMVDEALRTHRMIGMIQPQSDSDALYKTGCAGKITEFSETGDRRYLITLTGVSRFTVIEELEMQQSYRLIRPGWEAYNGDLKSERCVNLNRPKLKALLQKYFEREDMECDWDAVDDAPDQKLITCLSMACPLEPEEKQALLEADCCESRANLFMTMLEMAVCNVVGCESKH